MGIKSRCDVNLTSASKYFVSRERTDSRQWSIHMFKLSYSYIFRILFIFCPEHKSSITKVRNVFQKCFQIPTKENFLCTSRLSVCLVTSVLLFLLLILDRNASRGCEFDFSCTCFTFNIIKLLLHKKNSCWQLNT